MSKNITPRNKEGKRHGYWERYWSDGKIMYKGYWANGKRVGYWEEYYSDGEIFFKGYFNNGKRVGYREDYFWAKGIQIYI